MHFCIVKIDICTKHISCVERKNDVMASMMSVSNLVHKGPRPLILHGFAILMMKKADIFFTSLHNITHTSIIFYSNFLRIQHSTFFHASSALTKNLPRQM